MSKINASLQSLAVPIVSLHEDPDNARAHDERNLSAIKMSLAHFGQQKAIVIDQTGCVIAGNGTLRAAKDLGWKEIAAVRFDSNDEHAKRSYAIADNKTAELAAWDYSALSATFGILSENSPDLMATTGFSKDEIESILANSSWQGVSDDEVPGGKDYKGQKFIRVRVKDAEYVEDVVEALKEVVDRFGEDKVEVLE